jgi:hypothetical protein
MANRIEEAREQWLGIRNETVSKRNTAVRVGDAGLALLEAATEALPDSGVRITARWGTSTKETITGADIAAFAERTAGDGETFVFAAGGYKYFALPPAVTPRFRHAGMAVAAMRLGSVNGYAVWRSENILGAEMEISLFTTIK